MITAGQVCRALRTDGEPSSGIVRDSFGYPAQPMELWLASARLWVRRDGYVTGWPGGNYVARRFGPLGSWRIRRAFNNRLATYKERP